MSLPADDYPNMDDLNLSDTDTDALFDSPPTYKKKSKTLTPNADPSSEPPSVGQKSRTGESHYSTQEAREAALRKELESVRNVNRVIEDVVESLEKARNNMDTVHRTVTSATTLLQTWTRILSQTEHNQRLILNPGWNGASQDLADIETEALQQQQAAKRRELEEQARREAAQRKAEEEERRRVAAEVGKGTRGRGSTRGRVSSTASSSTRGSGYVGVGGQGGRGAMRGSSSSRAGSGIGRGLRGSRGRGLS